MRERDGQTRDKVNTMGCKLQPKVGTWAFAVYSSFQLFCILLKIFLGNVGKKGGKKKRCELGIYYKWWEIPKGHFSKKWPLICLLFAILNAFSIDTGPLETHLTWNMAKINSVFSFPVAVRIYKVSKHLLSAKQYDRCCFLKNLLPLSHGISSLPFRVPVAL